MAKSPILTNLAKFKKLIFFQSMVLLHIKTPLIPNFRPFGSISYRFQDNNIITFQSHSLKSVQKMAKSNLAKLICFQSMVLLHILFYVDCVCIYKCQCTTYFFIDTSNCILVESSRPTLFFQFIKNWIHFFFSLEVNPFSDF